MVAFGWQLELVSQAEDILLNSKICQLQYTTELMVILARQVIQIYHLPGIGKVFYLAWMATKIKCKNKKFSTVLYFVKLEHSHVLSTEVKDTARVQSQLPEVKATEIEARMATCGLHTFNSRRLPRVQNIDDS